MADLDAWLDAYEPHETEATICAANGLVAAHARAEAELVQAQGEKAILAAAKKVAELEERIQASSRTFRFRSLPTKEWADLLAAHAPTEQQVTADPGVEFNDDTFPAAATAASSADDPALTVEQVDRIRATVQHSEWSVLWGKVLEANLGVLSVPKSLLAGVVLRRNGGSGTTRARRGSRAASSSAGS